jgi:hypothetical protein
VKAKAKILARPMSQIARTHICILIAAFGIPDNAEFQIRDASTIPLAAIFGKAFAKSIAA